jgi:uncharacterized protein YjbI with pentapeptide repeats
MTRAELDRILNRHRQWVARGGGERADLSNADLTGAHLYDANLTCADLYGADLSGANLRDAYLYGADLAGANLRDAYLYGANLRDADLDRANLRGADLSGAYLLGADLGGANLRGVRTNWFTRMTARGARNLTDEQRDQLGMQPPRAGNARRGRSATQLARRLAR